MSTSPTPSTPASRSRFLWSKNDLYRVSRMLHAYLSAFAFIALIFFALTGLLLNHTSWLDGKGPEPQESTLTLSAQDIQKARQAPFPEQALAQLVAQKTPLLGAYKSGEILDEEAMIRFEGVKGKSDLTINLESGETEVTVEKAKVTDMILDLHRGKNSGATWSWIIDITAVLVLALSLIGYILFFTLRFRLAMSIRLTVWSLIIIGGIFWFCVP